jgi:hypothetical protein
MVDIVIKVCVIRRDSAIDCLIKKILLLPPIDCMRVYRFVSFGLRRLREEKRRTLCIQY